MNPIEPFADGRDKAGRFAPGNAGGPGNPHGGRVAALRRAMLEAVTDDDLRAIVQVLVSRAKSGSPWAVREVLDRCIGKPALSVTVDPDDDRPRHFVMLPPRVLGED